jgi:hypothetical protein
VKAVDLTGRRFGCLVVVRLDGRRGKVRTWECLCDCGRSKVIRGGDLTGGATTSCRGCVEQSMIGSRFGKLLVVAQSDRRGVRGMRYWLTQCDCGGRSEASTSNLRFGASRSCGRCRIRHGASVHGARLRRVASQGLLYLVHCLLQAVINEPFQRS